MSSKDFRNQIKSNLYRNNNENNQEIQSDQKKEQMPEKQLEAKTFRITKKQDDKANKKAFNVYMEQELLKQLDKVCRKTGYSRNELINMMCQFCLENLEILE